MIHSRLALFTVLALTAPVFVWGALDVELWQPSLHFAETLPSFVEQVRQATQSLRDVRQATKAEYAPVLGCVSGPQEGAMGVHYVNSTFLQDGELDVNRPEALMYESTNGTLRLLGVEYIVTADAWHARHAEPPTLEGQVFNYTASPNRYGLPAFYELHVWAWRGNPHGTFVDWNPHVSCDGQ
jgi:hypothetical protein